MVPVIRSCQSPVWIWLVNYVQLHLHLLAGHSSGGGGRFLHFSHDHGLNEGDVGNEGRPVDKGDGDADVRKYVVSAEPDEVNGGNDGDDGDDVDGADEGAGGGPSGW